MAKTFQDEIVEELKAVPFALNLDEALNSNNQKVLSVLVSFFFSESQKHIVVHHLQAFIVTKVTSEALFQRLDVL